MVEPTATPLPFFFPSTDHGVSITGHLNMNHTDNQTVCNKSAIQHRDEGLADVEEATLGCILILAIFGNTCVLVALGLYRKKASRMHLFIMHLSITDLLMAFLNVLPQFAWEITFRFQGGDIPCRLVKYVQIFAIYASTYVLVMTSIDRYCAICHPLSNYSWTVRRVNTMVGIAYVIACISSIPQLFLFSYREMDPIGCEIYDCWVVFPSETFMKVYIVCFTSLIYFIPLIILVYTYGRICYTVWVNVRQKTAASTQKTHSNGTHGNDSQNNTSNISKMRNNAVSSLDSGPVQPRTHSIKGLSRAKVKTVKLTLVVILAYVVCWSPFFIVQLLWAFDAETPEFMGDAFVIFILLASLNSCCNPWIYMAFSGNLIQQFIPCCKKRVGKWSKSNTNENKLEHNVGFARQRLKVLSNKNKRFERRSSSLTSFGSTLRGSKAGSDDINHMSNYTRSTSASEHLFSGHVRPDAQQVNRPDERQSLLKKQTANAFYPVDV